MDYMKHSTIHINSRMTRAINTDQYMFLQIIHRICVDIAGSVIGFEIGIVFKGNLSDIC
jgi:hypothetical protein